mgnify:CR=1 FL=1
MMRSAICTAPGFGARQMADLIINGLIGYLRPKALNVGSVDATKSPTLTASEKEQAMATPSFVAKIVNGKQINAIVQPQSGFCHTFESADGEYNSNVARTFGVVYPSSIVSESHFDKLVADCAAVRAGK